jgi:hypothetical protein
MGMNNIFYRFHHLTKDEKYATMPPTIANEQYSRAQG